MEKTIKYPHPNGEITVLWKPELCTHAGVCVRLLPEVYKPNERPWSSPDKAIKTELIDQINKCPSGALSYQLNK
jgi:uncharacterized Fe-S cluster protein YjdI